MSLLTLLDFLEQSPVVSGSLCRFLVHYHKYQYHPLMAEHFSGSLLKQAEAHMVSLVYLYGQP